MNPRSPRRSGFSLVELLTTITVLTVLLGLCAGLIRLLIKLDQAGRDAMTTSSDQMRLARIFREDLHRATLSVPPITRPDRLTVSLPDDFKAVYEIQPSDVLRELRQGDKLRQREVYRVPRRTSVWFEQSTEAGRPLISIVIHREPPRAGEPAEPESRTDAEFGRLERLIARKP